ncbi:TPA: bifunctional phosphoglucose/phosphomannose isomerase [Patescibacteria group bacterium]|uniref:Bifunctional phosphoglucose/phosphomannose isomerase n=2 Tax=Bacteria division Kazan-3B-28 TaxID=1798534 RepID=A0A0G1ZFW2_UNCK3|nr:MAG: bifunctional phosphoglucose/phosphomannose isomerase, glucose/mannose-6-phosphate isomerase [candidate division Kazan bacterium GW2011_GWA1_50_15]KKW25476.1 MAG: Bifunctional phosphoglucose/phosphomannose isomerase [candidate division Kazan bacterium GW2011_GWC1_52_13]KKW26782.1 MAG: Bifunctional phosphoglucose/phosphomannose isomerase [candidate division Kazan bacterium GW2011_GWB1_52_7]HAV65777.1 bifunctional phosphoglucose/phosphomannose isomerase [Patescibacteria group bacterium]HCL
MTLDPSNMHRMIADFPLQFAKGFDLALKTEVRTPVERVILTGMGGSALAGDLVNAAFAEDITTPLLISRNYTIPFPLDDKTLVIANSFSGNTEETLSAYDQALESGAQVIAMASGGRLLERAMKDGVQYIKTIKESSDFQPRMSSGYIFAILTALLIKAGHLPWVSEKQVREMADWLASVNTELPGKQLGESLFGTIPLVYASDAYWPVARIAKIKLNENSKIPAFWNTFPEINHNEMVGFTNTRDNYRVVILRDPDDDPRANKRMEITAEVLRGQGIGLKATIWDMMGRSRLEKIFSTLGVMDWSSYYLAQRMGIDPTPVKLVEDFKALLK